VHAARRRLAGSQVQIRRLAPDGFHEQAVKIGVDRGLVPFAHQASNWSAGKFHEPARPAILGAGAGAVKHQAPSGASPAGTRARKRLEDLIQPVSICLRFAPGV
jgi:hypothetical protein